MSYFIWAMTFIFIIISYRKDKERTTEALRMSIRSLKKLSPGILGMVFLVGLILTIFPKENLVAIFNHKGLYGFLLVSLIGSIATVPGPIALPLAGTLLQMGARLDLLASFITTLTMVGIVSAPLEVSYFGKRFTIMRQSLSFIAAVIIGLLMGKIL